MEKSSGRTVLFVDDYPASPSRGAGLPRAFDHISYIKKQGKDVLCMHSSRSQVEPNLNFNFVIASRPNNFLLGLKLASQNNVPLIYDAESLFFLKQKSKIQYKKYLEIEKIIAKKADGVIAISPFEAEWFRENGAKNVWLIDPFPEHCEVISDRESRRPEAIMIAGWLSGPGSPNDEGLRWFSQESLPRILQRCRDFKLKVTGADPPRNLVRSVPEEVEFVGEISDLQKYLSNFLFSINPVLHASGVNLKVVDSLSSGVPVVSTATGALLPDKKWRSGMLSTNNPDYFAECCISLIKNSYYYNNIFNNLKQICLKHNLDKSAVWNEIFSFYED